MIFNHVPMLEEHFNDPCKPRYDTMRLPIAWYKMHQNLILNNDMIHDKWRVHISEKILSL